MPHMIDPNIIYEDNHLLIVEKPQGLLSQADASLRPDILSWAKAYRQKPGQAYVGLVHRLDFKVGGLLALAKTSKAAERLSAQFRTRTIKKIYWALVEGCPKGHSGILNDQLFREGSRTRLASLGEKAATACLSWQLLAGDENFSLLEIDLKTGFKHQIRFQLANFGHPILGDTKYGAHQCASGVEAIALWARSLRLLHPTKKEEMAFISTPPQSWPFTLAYHLIAGQL